MSKVYDSLMKSGAFTAAQNKAETGEFVDSIGELVSMCEKDGYIERFYIEQPNDKVDITLQDMQRYTRSLVEEETNLSNLIEIALQQNQREDDKAADEEAEVYFDEIEELLEQDYSDFADFLDNETALDFEEGE